MPKQPYHADPTALHTTRRDVLKRCPRRFMIEYVLGFDKKETSEPLRMGSAFAFALEHGSADQVYKYYNDEHILKSKAAYDIEIFEREAAITEVYADLYLQKYPETVEREVMWQFPIDAPTSLGWSDAGTMDFVQRAERGIFAGEDKLKGQWTENDLRALDVDDQVTGEIFALKRLRPNENVLGLKYRVTKKAQISQRTKKQPETFPDFLKRLREKLEDESEDRFMEFTLTRTPEELQEFADELAYTAEYIEWNLGRYRDDKPAFAKQPKNCAFNGGCAHPLICCSGGNIDAELLRGFYTKKDAAELLQTI